MLFYADFRQTFTLKEVNLEKQNKQKKLTPKSWKNETEVWSAFEQLGPGALVRGLASQQFGPGFDSQTQLLMWIEFVGSLLSSDVIWRKGTHFSKVPNIFGPGKPFVKLPTACFGRPIF